MIYIGCCGFCTAQKKYFETFDTIEVQKTFYNPPAINTLMKWKENAPNNFTFTLKAWQLITHTPKSPTYRKLAFSISEDKINKYGSFRPTDEVFKAWEITAQCAKALNAKLIVFQTPASFKPEKENLNNMKIFFEEIDRYGFRLGFEPRGKEWTEEKVLEICSELKLIDVVDPFTRMPVYGDIFYFRLHGKGGYKYKYTNENLLWLKGIIDRDQDGFVMFNNVYMFEDAIRFKNIINGDDLDT